MPLTKITSHNKTLGDDIKEFGFAINITEESIGNTLYRAILFVPMERNYVEDKINDLVRSLEKERYKKGELKSMYGKAYLLIKELK